MLTGKIGLLTIDSYGKYTQLQCTDGYKIPVVRIRYGTIIKEPISKCSMESVRTCVAMRLVVETRAGQELILESPESPWLPEEKNSVGLVRVYHIFNPNMAAKFLHPTTQCFGSALV